MWSRFIFAKSVQRVNIVLFSEAYGMFMREQRLRRNSTSTIEYYTIALDKFHEFIGDLTTDDLTLELYKAYTLYLLNDTGLKSTSVNSYLRAVKAFYNYLIFEEIIPDISRRLKLVKQDKSVIMPLSDREAEKLLASCSCFGSLELRNKCIVVLMLDSGLRLGEVIRLKISDVDVENSFLLVNGKGSKQRIVPIGTECAALITAYIENFRSYARSSAPLFVSKYGDRPVTTNTVHCFFEDLKHETGILRLYPHLLRHTFATMYIYDGGNLETLRCILGHSTIAITQIYLHLAANYRLAYGKHQSHLDKQKSTSK